MRIGINALYLIPGGVGGTEIYLRNLLAALARFDTTNEYFVVTNAETGTAIDAGRMQLLPQAVRATNRPARLLFEQTELPALAHRHRFDCLLNPGFTAPAALACPNVTVFHDLQHKRHPEYFRRFDLPAWNLFLWIAVKRSRILIADSAATAADITRYYNVAPERIRTVPLGVEDEFFRLADCRAPEPFFLCTSTLHPHKNLERLIHAFSEFRGRRPGHRLVITGVRGFHAQAVETLAAACDGAVELTGWISRERLYDLFRRASALFYPSTFEGFGLPVVEAMAAGVPLACSDIEPLRSIVGDAAIRFRPDDTAAIVDAMERIDDSLVAAARERAQAFTWEACARGTLEAIRDAVSGAVLRAGSWRPSSRPDT